jgi:hypothetical protein
MIGRLSVILLALAAALLPLPETAVERWYSTGLYPRLQRVVTSISNLIPLALLDIGAAILIAIAVAQFVRRARRTGARSALRLGVRDLAVTAAVLYLVFLGMWGFNYRRLPLERKIDYDEARITRESAIRLAREAIRLVNAQHEAAHRTAADDTALAAAFADAQRILGSRSQATIGLPKTSVLGVYFRRAAIDGMTDPFFLEIMLNPDLLPVERPFVIAHEWAHLAGHAEESEANFVAWLTCARGDALARYSGWLAAYQYSAGSLGREDRRRLPPLEEGPRADLKAVQERYRRASPAVRAAAREVYDSYLRANRVDEGIASYDAVLRLMLGSSFDEAWTPRLRSR